MKALERSEVALRATEALCSTCARRVAAEVVERGGSVFLDKRCPIHGRHSELLEEDAAYVRRMPEYDHPDTPARIETQIDQGCPYDCGLCPQHARHTCIALIEVTESCDLDCPVCYADSGGPGFLSMDEVERMLDAYQEAEGGKAEVLQISGGEPTLHPRVLDIIRSAQAKGIRYVMLNTNGLRCSRDPEFAKALGQFKKGFELYLQFDGLDDAVHNALRGRDLAAVKGRALENLGAGGVPVTLVTTVQSGVNEDQLGRIVAFGLAAPNVRGVNFQPAAFFGRCQSLDPGRRVTMTGVLRRLERQLGGMVRIADFVPLPCDVDRVAITLLLRGRGGFTPLARRTDVREYLPLMKDTLAFYPQDAIKGALGALCTGGPCCGLKLLRDFAPFAGPASRALFSRDRRAFTSDNVFRITVTSFLDRFNFESRAMRRECVHILTRDGRRIPFSAYNLVHRRGSEHA